MANTIDAFPRFLNTHITLKIDERPLDIRFTSSEWTDFWRPFLIKLAEARAQFPHRMMVAIAGPPGTGKSLFAGKLNWLINADVIHGLTSVALSQDGFHYDGYYLKSNVRALPDGGQVLLADVKGAYDTFNAEDLKERIELLRANASEVGWPAYDRTEHETVSNRFRVPQKTSIVFVEGTHLLLEAGPYAGMPQLFDLKIFLDTPGPKIIAGLMERHMTGGKTMDEAKAWIKRVDLPNAQLVASSKSKADVLIKRNDDDELESFVWRGAKLAV